jgi:hypothetical protein
LPRFSGLLSEGKKLVIRRRRRREKSECESDFNGGFVEFSAFLPSPPGSPCCFLRKKDASRSRKNTDRSLNKDRRRRRQGKHRKNYLLQKLFAHGCCCCSSTDHTIQHQRRRKNTFFFWCTIIISIQALRNDNVRLNRMKLTVFFMCGARRRLRASETFMARTYHWKIFLSYKGCPCL